MIFDCLNGVCIENDDLKIMLMVFLVTGIGSFIPGIIIFLFKRYFINKDFENRQKIEHSSWLLKQSHSFAKEHYVLLTRHLKDSCESFVQAKNSKNDIIIKTTYEYLVTFIKKYDLFKKETGANFLFIDRKNEIKAIKKMQSLFFTLPFDDKDIKSIVENKSTRPLSSFTNWIKSDNCTNSQKIVKDRLYELWTLLDKESDKIMQHKQFLEHNKEQKKKECKNTVKKNKEIKKKNKNCEKQMKIQNDDLFYIHKVEPRYVGFERKVLIFGKGFKTENITYDIKIKDQKLETIKIHDTVIEITIPNLLSSGTYDITADFKLNGIIMDEQMGLAIHIAK